MEKKKERYYVRKVIGRDVDGRAVFKTFSSTKSQYAAEKKARDFLASSEKEKSPGVLFENYTRHWLETYKDGAVRPNTFRESYEKICELHLIPYFGHRAMNRIYPEDIRSFFNAKSKYSASQRKKFKINLNQIFEAAIDEQLIDRNPLRGIKIQEETKPKQPKCWKEAHYKAAMKYADVHKYGLGIQIMLSLGLRCSELLGLRWSDIDFFENIVHIQRAAVVYAGTVVVGETKSKNSDRYLPVPIKLAERLKKERGDRSRDGYLFPMVNDQRKPMSTSYYTKHRVNVFMEDLYRETGVPPINCHGLRHTFGTLLWNKTSDLLAVSKAMGHSTLEVTKSFYVHEDVEMLRTHLGPAMEELSKPDKDG